MKLIEIVNKIDVKKINVNKSDFPKLENKKDLEKLFPEFLDFLSQCKFRDCIHVNEPNCVIKENVENGNIDKIRYEFYLTALENIFK